MTSHIFDRIPRLIEPNQCPEGVVFQLWSEEGKIHERGISDPNESEDAAEADGTIALNHLRAGKQIALAIFDGDSGEIIRLTVHEPHREGEAPTP